MYGNFIANSFSGSYAFHQFNACDDKLFTGDLPEFEPYSEVPEPLTMALTGSALAILAGAIRRRTNKALQN
jgi:hypothetical protein